MKAIGKFTILTAAATAVAIALPATASACGGPPPAFHTPSGNIMCWLDEGLAQCRIVDYTYSAAKRPPDCGWSGKPNGFYLREGAPAVLECNSRPPGTYNGSLDDVALDYGQSKSEGVITCLSETSGVTCTDTRSKHFFFVSRDSYELG